MATLEAMKPGTAIRGIVPDGLVTIVLSGLGPAQIELTTTSPRLMLRICRNRLAIGTGLDD